MNGRYLYKPDVHHCDLPRGSAPEHALWQCDCGRYFRGAPFDQRDAYDSGWRRCSRWRAHRILRRALASVEGSKDA